MKKMEQTCKCAQVIVQFMKDELNFVISQQDISTGKINNSAIHINLDVNRQVFFKPYFDNLKNNYQNLLQDKRKNEALNLIRHAKSDLNNMLYEQVLFNDSQKIHFHLVNL